MEEQENHNEVLNPNGQIHTSDVTNRSIVDYSNLEIYSEICKIKEIENDDRRNKSASDCIFRISFNDESKFMELKEGIKKSLSSYFVTKKIDVEFLDDTNLLDISVIKQQKIDDIPLFMISVDTSPIISSRTETIPSYKRSIKDVLDFGKLSETIQHCERPKTNLCFNCSGSHTLKDCPEPRNQQKINKARKQYMCKNERYHIDVDQRLAHLKPGKLSTSLKNALGLKSRELPSFFYRMRVFGYPPGWLEESKIANSGITLIDSEDIAITSDNDCEPGEHKFDSSKIISFPGFNVDPGPGYYDDFKFYNVPAMHFQQKKETFIQTLSENLGTQEEKNKNKRKKINIPLASKEETESESVSRSKVIRLNPQTEYEEPLNIDTMKEPTSEEINMNQRTETNIKSRRSPSLADLEEQQVKLLEALQKSACSIVSEESFIDESKLKINDDNLSIEENSIIGISSSSISENINNPGTPKNVLLGSNKKSSVLGTPVLKFSVFDQLPNGDNFKQGVSDVINFENLPDSTGKYEEMKILLNKIRLKISKFNKQEH